MLLIVLRSPEPKGLTCKLRSEPVSHLFKEGLQVVSKDPPSSKMLGVQQLHCNQGTQPEAENMWPWHHRDLGSGPSAATEC